MGSMVANWAGDESASTTPIVPYANPPANYYPQHHSFPRIMLCYKGQVSFAYAVYRSKMTGNVHDERVHRALARDMHSTHPNNHADTMKDIV